MKITGKSIKVISEYAIEDTNGDEYIVRHHTGSDDNWIPEYLRWEVMTVDDDLLNDGALKNKLIESVKKELNQ